MTQEIGVFTPERARIVSDVVEFLLNSGFIFPKGKKKDATPPPVTPIFIKNESGETLPAFGCAQITGTYELGGQNYFTVDKPQDEYGTNGAYLFNSAFAVEDDGLGVASPGVEVRALSSGSINSGDRVSPTVDSWEVQQDDSGLFLAGGPDDIGDSVQRIFLYPSNAAAEGISFIEFEITALGEESTSSSLSESESTSSGDSDLCDSRADDAPGFAYARVIRRPCGVSVVPGEVDGEVTIYDSSAGGFLKERQADEVEGKRGFAVYLSNPDYEPPEGLGSISSESLSSDEPRCQWIITWIDWFRWTTGVEDIIFGENQITVERHNFKVWDECKLEDEIIEGADCSTGSSSGGSS